MPTKKVAKKRPARRTYLDAAGRRHDWKTGKFVKTGRKTAKKGTKKRATLTPAQKRARAVKASGKYCSKQLLKSGKCKDDERSFKIKKGRLSVTCCRAKALAPKIKKDAQVLGSGAAVPKTQQNAMAKRAQLASAIAKAVPNAPATVAQVASVDALAKATKQAAKKAQTQTGQLSKLFEKAAAQTQTAKKRLVTNMTAQKQKATQKAQTDRLLKQIDQLASSIPKAQKRSQQSQKVSASLADIANGLADIPKKAQQQKGKKP